MKNTYYLILVLIISILFTGCGIKRSIQKGVSTDYYHNINEKNKSSLNTLIESDYIIFTEIDGKPIADEGGLILGIGPRKIYLTPGEHTFKVYTGLSTLTFKKILIEEGHHYFFDYIHEETFWLKDLTKNVVVYGYEPKEDD